MVACNDTGLHSDRNFQMQFYFNKTVFDYLSTCFNIFLDEGIIDLLNNVLAQDK